MRPTSKQSRTYTNTHVMSTAKQRKAMRTLWTKKKHRAVAQHKENKIITITNHTGNSANDGGGGGGDSTNTNNSENLKNTLIIVVHRPIV